VKLLPRLALLLLEPLREMDLDFERGVSDLDRSRFGVWERLRVRDLPRGDSER